MKFYLAARYSRNAEMRGYRYQLQSLGHIVTSRWIDQHGGDLLESIGDDRLNAEPGVCAHYAETDVLDLLAAETIVSFTSADGGGKGGRHIEFGLALGLAKTLIIVGPRENIFHTLPEVSVYPNWDAFLMNLRSNFGRKVAGDVGGSEG
jgi:hypothetical protein